MGVEQNRPMKLFLQEAVPEQNPIPGAVIAIQTFGDFLGFNPHCHVLVTDGCFLRQAQDSVYGRGMFRVAPPLDLKKLEAIFRHRVFKMLLAKGRITRDLIAMLSNWRHSRFQVFCGQRLFPQDETAMENLARYIIRASFSQEQPKNRANLLSASECRQPRAQRRPQLQRGSTQVDKGYLGRAEG